MESGLVWEADRAADLLDRLGFGYLRQIGGSGFVETMNIYAMPSPGVCYIIAVRERDAEKVRELLAEHQIATDEPPEFWDSNPDLRANRFWKIIAWYNLLLLAVAILFGIGRELFGWF